MNMNFRKNMLGLVVASIMGATTFVASADDMYRGAWYAVPGVNYMSTDSDLDADDGGGAFIRFGKELSENWDVQGGLSYNTANADAARLSSNTGIAGSTGRYRQTALGLDAMYMFSRDKFRPFVLAGLGVARNDMDYTFPGVGFDGKKTSWMANVGVGAQYLVSDTFGLQVDLRQQWSRVGANVTVAGFSASDSATISNTLLSIGAVIRFGEPAPAPVVTCSSAPAHEVACPSPAPVIEEIKPTAELIVETPVPTPEPVVEAPKPVEPPLPSCKPQFETVTISAEKLFGFDKATLQNGSKPILDEVVAKLKANPDIELVMITGHTDRLGSTAYNQKLSERRAAQVKAYLVSRGIAKKRLQAVGMGEAEPVVACDGIKNRQKLIECLQPNRRVVLAASKQRELGCK